MERELLAEITQLCGRAAMEGDGRGRPGYGGFWRLAIRSNPVAVREAISDLRLRQRDPNLLPPKNPGGMLRKLYERIVAEEKPHHANP